MGYRFILVITVFYHTLMYNNLNEYKTVLICLLISFSVLLLASQMGIYV